MHESLIKHAIETDKPHVYACTACKLYDSFLYKVQKHRKPRIHIFKNECDKTIQNKKGPL